MVESKAITQDPKIVAVIGPYELLPAEKGSNYMTEVWLGTEGAIWPDCPTDPILWREVTTLDVIKVHLEKGVRAHVLEAVTGPTVLAPDARDQALPICQGYPSAAMTAREQLLADRLLQYFGDRGVTKESLPIVDLTGNAPKRPTPAKAQETAARRLHDFEAVCSHGDDPALGRYVEFPPDTVSLKFQAIASLIVLGIALYIWQAGLLLKHGSLSPDNPIGLAVAAVLGIVGFWWLAQVLWLSVRPCRLRVGENGFAVMPKGPAILWSDIASFELRPTSLGRGRRLQVLANARGDVQRGRVKRQSRTWRLPPLRSPSTLPAVEYLMNTQLEAFTARGLIAASHQSVVQPEP